MTPERNRQAKALALLDAIAITEASIDGDFAAVAKAIPPSGVAPALFALAGMYSQALVNRMGSRDEALELLRTMRRQVAQKDVQ